MIAKRSARSRANPKLLDQQHRHLALVAQVGNGTADVLDDRELNAFLLGNRKLSKRELLHH
jgi:hypothetical protein